MRKLILLALAALALASPACKRRRHPNPMATIEDESPLASVVSMADPAASSQLLSGFHAVEHNAWRWSARKFSLSLAVPENAATRGARLQLKAVLPDVIARQMLGVKITPSVSSQPLAPHQFNQTGEHVAAFDVPAELLNTAAVIVDFELDKAIPPREGESRELGLVIAQVSLVTR
jgi:hypothetical protein